MDGVDLFLLRQAIDAQVSLTEEEWNQLRACVRVRSFSKNELLLKEGSVCNYLIFILSGAVVYYSLSEKGEEITTDFALEGSWVTDNRSRLSQTPSHLNIKAIEPTEVVIIAESDLNELYRQIPKMEHLGRILIEQAYVRLVQLSLDLQILSAEERYLKLLRDYPAAVKRLPLYHIANYLGVAPKSLSRIRGKLT
ncbi:MAG: Crp/Fnr family transcriptional regulator [Paludibacter sp.]|nr:Crp/Fnr family transcriptional regulator [Paludibacter sp.]